MHWGLFVFRCGQVDKVSARGWRRGGDLGSRGRGSSPTGFDVFPPGGGQGWQAGACLSFFYFWIEPLDELHTTAGEVPFWRGDPVRCGRGGNEERCLYGSNPPFPRPTSPRIATTLIGPRVANCDPLCICFAWQIRRRGIVDLQGNMHLLHGMPIGDR